MTMPLDRCGPSPASAGKSGSAANATFMRNVPEPHLYAAIRARKSSGWCSAATRRSNSSFGLTFATTRFASTTSPESSSTPVARPPLTTTRATGEPVRISTPRAAHAFAIACVIAPMPPIAWPHCPCLPLTSPKTWWSSTYADPGVYGLAKLPTIESKPNAALIGADSNQRSSTSPALFVKRSRTSRWPARSSRRKRFATFHASSSAGMPPPTLGGVASSRSRSTAATRSSMA